MPAWNQIYQRSPILLQTAAVSLAGWWTQQRRFGRDFRSRLAAAEARLDLPATELLAYRDQKLHDFVSHCATTVPYYRRQFQALGCDPREIRTLDDLRRLPVLSKAEVRERQAEFYSDLWPPHRCWRRGTGGTTGASLRFVATPAAVREQWAIWWRYWRWHGINPDTWCGYFVGLDIVPLPQRRPPFWRLNRPRRQLAFSIFHLRPDTMPSYVEELRRRRLPWLHGYPSVLALLARHLLDDGADLGYHPRWITTGAENLLPHQVDLIQAAFGTRPRQHYGLAEGTANLSECPAGNLHVDEDFAAVEFVDRGKSGDDCRLIGSNLANPAFCLLRYDTGDLVVPGPAGPCPCGRPGRLAARIDGRQEDVLVLEDGTCLGRLAHIFEGLDCLQEAQFVQARPGAVLLNIVPRAGYTASDEQAVLAAARRRLGPTTAIEVRYLDAIAREPNGKLRFVRSLIAGGGGPHSAPQQDGGQP